MIQKYTKQIKKLVKNLKKDVSKIKILLQIHIGFAVRKIGHTDQSSYSNSILLYIR